MGRAFEYRKATKLKRWGNMARTFTRVGKQIAIAVKAGGPEPENNPQLRAVIATAKRENMPKDNIERAIKNAMGKEQKDYKEMVYEGYGPFGIAILVETATDNTTRTVANVRSVFTKFGGSLGTSGSLDFMFHHKSVFTIGKKADVSVEDLILELIDYGVDEDYDEDGEEVTLYAEFQSFSAIQKYLEENGYDIKSSEFTRIPTDEKEVTEEQRATIDKIVERLEEDEDVQNVYTNMKPEEEEE
jgi:YebC/PmpR family DNA-binding regulatory protein